MSLTFKWDADKARTNERKHGVSFDEAATVFEDPLSIAIPDPDHSEDEDRFILMGSTYLGRVLVVVHTDRVDNIRIISARLATKTERRAYEQ